MVNVAKADDACNDTRLIEPHEIIERMRARTDVNFHEWFDRERDEFAEYYRLSNDDVRRILNDTKPRYNADRFKWLEAVTATRPNLKAMVVASALFLHAGEHGYCWPSQRRLAAMTGTKDEREVRRGLEALEKAGMIRTIKVVDLPTDLAGVALGAGAQGGSGRSYRGVGYALVDPDEWRPEGS